MADGNSGSGGGWFWLILVIALVGGGYLYQREGGKIFGPDGLAGNSGQKEAIEQALRADSRTTTGVNSVVTVVARMRRINLSKCPSDFKTAYTDHIHAWELLAEVEREAVAFDANFNSGGAMFEAFVRGLMMDPFGKAREATAEQNRLKSNYQKATTEIHETFQRVERAALAHGAEMPKRPEPGYTWVSESPDDTRVKWTPGSMHREYPNIVAGEKDRDWKPAPGFKWVSDAPGDLLVAPR